MGLDDPRSVGSNNPGATNVLRHGGKKAAIITLIGDMLKGLVPVIAVTMIEPAAAAIALTGLGAFLGHVFPVYYGFKGGKGVATYYGVLLGFSWVAGIAALLIWLLAALAQPGPNENDVHAAGLLAGCLAGWWMSARIIRRPQREVPPR